MYGQTLLDPTVPGTYPKFARYGGVSASIWGTVPVGFWVLGFRV